MNHDNIFAAILAGGMGTRMQSEQKPKQFLEVGGKPIIIHTIEKFISIENFTIPIEPLGLELKEVEE